MFQGTTKKYDRIRLSTHDRYALLVVVMLSLGISIAPYDGCLMKRCRACRSLAPWTAAAEEH